MTFRSQPRSLMGDQPGAPRTCNSGQTSTCRSRRADAENVHSLAGTYCPRGAWHRTTLGTPGLGSSTKWASFASPTRVPFPASSRGRPPGALDREQPYAGEVLHRMKEQIESAELGGVTGRAALHTGGRRTQIRSGGKSRDRVRRHYGLGGAVRRLPRGTLSVG